MLSVSFSTLLFTVLNLLILLVLMKKFLYRPVLGIIEKRQELIDSQFAQARVSREEAEKMKQQYETCLSDAKAEQAAILKDAKAQAGAEYDKILAEADARAKQIIADARQASLTEKEKAVKEADTEIAKLVMESASKLVWLAADEKSDSMVYEEFLKKAGESDEPDGK